MSTNVNIYNTGYRQNLYTNNKQNTSQNNIAKSEENIPKLLANSASEAVEKFEGYGVDKDGYFTDDFNEAAGIPKDFKIHKDTMESALRVYTGANSERPTKFMVSFDIAASAGKAYKVLSQIAPEIVNSSKSYFTQSEINDLPRGYEYDRASLDIIKVHKSNNDYISTGLSYPYNDNGQMLTRLFYIGAYNDKEPDVFNHNNGGKEMTNDVHINMHGERYKDKEGNISKGGLLISVMSNNLDTHAGEYSILGKIYGSDPSLSKKEREALKFQMEMITQDLRDNPKTAAIDLILASKISDFSEFTKEINKLTKELKKYEKEDGGMFQDFETLEHKLIKQIDKMLKEIIERQKKLQEEKRAKEKGLNIEA